MILVNLLIMSDVTRCICFMFLEYIKINLCAKVRLLVNYTYAQVLPIGLHVNQPATEWRIRNWLWLRDFFVVLRVLKLLCIDFKEIEMEDFADTHKFVRVDGVFVQNLVHIRPATTELFWEPNNCLLLLFKFFSNECSDTNHNEESPCLLLFCRRKNK